MITLRPSSFPSWNDCAGRTAATAHRSLITGSGYELRTPAKHIGAHCGTAVHVAAAYTLKAKLASGGGEIGNESEAVDRAQSALTEAVAADGAMFDGVTDTIPTAQKQIVRMTRSYRAEVAPQIQPKLVEERLTVTIAEGLSLSGRLDALGHEESGRLSDLKTGTRQRVNGAQYGTYSILFRSAGHQVEKLAEFYVPRVREHESQPWPVLSYFPVDVCEHQAVDIADDIGKTFTEFFRRLKTGDKPPENAFRKNPSSVLCSDRFCPAHGTQFCRAHLGAR